MRNSRTLALSWRTADWGGADSLLRTLGSFSDSLVFHRLRDLRQLYPSDFFHFALPLFDSDFAELKATRWNGQAAIDWKESFAERP